jgi:hypothetical protein
MEVCLRWMRFEPGKDSASKSLVIKNWWWEPGIKPTAIMQRALQLCFQRFLKYLGSDKLIIGDDAKAKTGLK